MRRTIMTEKAPETEKTYHEASHEKRSGRHALDLHPQPTAGFNSEITMRWKSPDERRTSGIMLDSLFMLDFFTLVIVRLLRKPLLIDAL